MPLSTDTSVFSPASLKTVFKLAARAVDSIGTSAFPNVLVSICHEISCYDSLVIYAFIKDRVPELLFSDLSEDDIRASWIPYFEGAYLLDPFYGLYRDGAPSGLYHLRDVAPDDFYDSEYFRGFYQSTHLSDETAIIIRSSECVQIHLSLGLRDQKSTIEVADLQRLELMMPLLIAVCSQQWPDTSTKSQKDTSAVAMHLENVFEQFGSSRLSGRECEIAKLVLMGHSSKSIARVLDISHETVKVYRKRLHTKLGITSQAELFSIFLKGLQKTPIVESVDPLVYALEG